MRMGLLACVLLLSGCVSPTGTPIPAKLDAAADAPAAVVVTPANVRAVEPLNRVSPNDVLFFNNGGLRALNITTTAPWTIHEILPSGRRDDPVFLLVVPAKRDETASCGPMPDAYRWHSFITQQGNLVGHAFPPGAYSLLLYSERLENLSLRLGAETQRNPRNLSSYAPAIGLEVLSANVVVDSVAFPYRVRFDREVRANESTLFLSEFRVRRNAHSGNEQISSRIADAAGTLCAERSESRNGATGVGAFESRFAATLGAQTYRWSGTFESHASANPRFDAIGYALRFVK